MRRDAADVRACAGRGMTVELAVELEWCRCSEGVIT